MWLSYYQQPNEKSHFQIEFSLHSKKHSTKSRMSKAKKFVYAKRFVGLPKLTDFQLEEEDLPELRHGGWIMFCNNLSFVTIV